MSRDARVGEARDPELVAPRDLMKALESPAVSRSDSTDDVTVSRIRVIESGDGEERGSRRVVCAVRSCYLHLLSDVREPGLPSGSTRAQDHPI